MKISYFCKQFYTEHKEKQFSWNKTQAQFKKIKYQTQRDNKWSIQKNKKYIIL